MTKTDADNIGPLGFGRPRLMSPFDPLPAPSPPRRSRARRAFEITGRVIVVLIVLGGVAFVLAAATGI